MLIQPVIIPHFIVTGKQMHVLLTARRIVLNGECKRDFEYVKWNDVAQDRVQWRGFVMMMKFRIRFSGIFCSRNCYRITW